MAKSIIKVDRLPDAELVERAVKGARKPGHPRWLAVMEIFAVGRNPSKALCREFNVNPNEITPWPEEDEGDLEEANWDE